MINLIGDEKKPKEIIFYDGINDVGHYCRSEIKKLASHSYELFFREKINESILLRLRKKTINFIISPYKDLLKSDIFKKNSSNKLYDCDTNILKSKKIAKHLITNWQTAFLIAKNNDAKFVGILQPLLQTSDVSFDYFDDKHKKRYYLLKKQVEAVYPQIINEINTVCKSKKDFCESLVDGRKWLKDVPNIFIDYAHVNAKGNSIIANKIKQLY